MSARAWQTACGEQIRACNARIDCGGFVALSPAGRLIADGETLPAVGRLLELIDHRAKLEAFCRAHGDLLKGRVMVYKHVEHWDIHDGMMEEHDATPDELDDAASQR